MRNPLATQGSFGHPRSLAGVAAVVVALASCTDPISAPGPDAPTGTLNVHVATLGSVIDEDGYWFRARDTADFIAPNGDFTVAGLAVGPLEVELGGLASNCGYVGDSLVNVVVEAGATTRAEFSVNCEAPDVFLIWELRLTGSELDPDGFTVILDGEEVDRLFGNFSDGGQRLRPGAHTLELSDIRANCVVERNPRDVFLLRGATFVREVFGAECVDAPGALEVTVETTGSLPDPDGYQVVLDGLDAAPIAPSGSIVLPSLPSDSLTVGLSGLAANCGLLGGERRVRIPAVDTIALALEVVCGTSSAVEYAGNQVAILDGAAPELGEEWTLEAWVWLDEDTGHSTLIQQPDVLRIEIDSDGPDHAHLSLFLTFTGTSIATDWGCHLVPGAWQHIAVTFNGALGLLRTYLNAELCRLLNLDATSTASSTESLSLGGSSFFPSEGNRRIDELRIWSEARTSDELRAERDRAIDPGLTTLMGYWPFNEGSGQVASDLTGSFADFVFGGATASQSEDPAWATPGRP